MSSRPPDPDLKNIWQNQKTEKETMTVEEVRLKARRYLSRKRRDMIARSVFEVLAAIFCGVAFLHARITPARVIAGLVMAMLLISTGRSLYFLFLRSRRNQSEIDADPASTMATCVDFYRSELERQRALARQPVWQLVAVLLIIAWLARNALMRSGSDPLRIVLPIVLFAAAGLIVLMTLRKFEAQRIQDEIDALDNFEEQHQ